METNDVRARVRASMDRQIAELKTQLVANAPPAGIDDDDAADMRALCDLLRELLVDSERVRARVDDDARWNACDGCGGEIGLARLIEQPAAERCAACADASADDVPALRDDDEANEEDGAHDDVPTMWSIPVLGGRKPVEIV
jgi:RNA polymerase-binding transcription factor DksA